MLACLSYKITDHASLSRPSTFLTPNRDTSQQLGARYVVSINTGGKKTGKKQKGEYENKEIREGKRRTEKTQKKGRKEEKTENGELRRI